jgi:hypothetical protein
MGMGLFAHFVGVRAVKQRSEGGVERGVTNFCVIFNQIVQHVMGELMLFSLLWDELEVLFGLPAGLGAFFDTSELMTPVTFKHAGPFMHGPDRIGVGTVKHLTALPPHIHKADLKQNAEVLGDGRLRQVECGYNVVYRALLGDEKAKNVAAAGFGHGVEGVGGGGSARHGLNYIPIQEYVKHYFFGPRTGIPG